MEMRQTYGKKRQFVFGAILFVILPAVAKSAPQKISRTYYIDCGASEKLDNGSVTAPLRTLEQVNALRLSGGDQILFKRGSVCKGSLHPQGSGSEGSSILAGAYGTGALPLITTGDRDEAAFRLMNQEYWEISSLDFSGGTDYGVYVGSNTAVVHHIYLRDLHVHDVRGKLKRKGSGLVVINSTGAGTFEDVNLDGIQASDTTQWAGIFISGSSREKLATHVSVRNSIVHDVQGDGIVLFNTQDGLIARSVAWHTGMQHALSIGTPNAIWTWQCADCVVEENEAFLTDSPGVDGGAFDIDYGNTRNTVRKNFAHDTQGYCVSVFGAFGPTTASVVDGNLCIHNGMSPRLAQRQGAIFLMTWEHGSINGADIRGNRIDWRPGGDTPAVRVGDDLQAQDVALSENEIWSNGTAPMDTALAYRGEKNHYVLIDAADEITGKTQDQFALRSEKDSTFVRATEQQRNEGIFEKPLGQGRDWRLVASIPISTVHAGGDAALRGLLVGLKSAALQFGSGILQVTLESDGDLQGAANDWELGEAGIKLVRTTHLTAPDLSLKLLTPTGKIAQNWTGYVGPVALGLALRQSCGQPAFGRLPFAKISATE